jgi:hypothetical protein
LKIYRPTSFNLPKYVFSFPNNMGFQGLRFYSDLSDELRVILLWWWVIRLV